MMSFNKYCLLALSCLPCVTFAACEVHFVAPVVDLGRTVYQSAAISDVPGYKQVGSQRTGILSILCDADRATLQLRVGNLIAATDQLLRWDNGKAASAMKMRVSRATAEGIPINMTVDEKAPAPAVNIVKDGAVLNFDLLPVHNKARHFTVEFQLTGLMTSNFVPLGSTTFSMSPQVELLAP
jgi:hypothetical protein